MLLFWSALIVNGREVKWEGGTSGWVLRLGGEKGGRVVRWQSDKDERVVRWQGGRFLVLSPRFHLFVADDR